jgi:radical SAM superfamily enzyme YgiQ (UPF0313 family)
MKVAVVYPEVLDMARYRDKRKEFPPFGALYIAASIENDGHSVVIKKLHPDSCTFDLTDFDAIVFSISASATFNMFMECRFKSLFAPDALIMAGGIHANLFPEQTLLDLKVDVVGIGEGEETIVELLKLWHTKDFSAVAGVCYMGSDRAPVRTPPRKLNKNIDNFPLPGRHLLDPSDFIMNDRMSNTNVKMTHIMPGRGCPFPCRFCASAQTQVQYRSGDDIRRELEHLIDNYGIKGFAVVGNDFILNKNNVKDICDKIGALDLQWATLSRVDRVDEEILKAMRKAGCYELEFGVEAGSEKILEAMDKKISKKQIINALKLTHASGIKNKVFLIHGYPGENYETTMETIELLEQIGDTVERVSLFRFVPLPGTYVYNFAKQFNIRGTYGSPEWDGDWGKFHIHHNHLHWWGTDEDFEMLNRSYRVLFDYIESRWPSRFQLNDLSDDKWALQSKNYTKTEINSVTEY